MKALVVLCGIGIAAPWIAPSAALENHLSKDHEFTANKEVLLTVTCYWRSVRELDDPSSSIEFMSEVIQEYCRSETQKRLIRQGAPEAVIDRSMELLRDVELEHRIMIGRQIIEHRTVD